MHEVMKVKVVVGDWGGTGGGRRWQWPPPIDDRGWQRWSL